MKRHGFTLVETLVVIAVIALLAGMLTGAAQYARRVAADGRCRTHVREIARAFYLYAEHHRGSAPDEYSPVSWDRQLAPYAPHREIFDCPGDKSRIARDTGLSYYWRNSLAVTNPLGAITRVNLQTAGPTDVVLVFDFKFHWHGDNTINVALLDTSAHNMGDLMFLDDMDRRVY